MKKIILLLIAAVLCCLPAGCGRGTADADAEAAPAPQPAATAVPSVEGRHLLVSIGMDGLIAMDDGVGRIISDRLNIEVSPVDVGEWDEESLRILQEAGLMPDLLRTDVRAPYITRWVAEGKLRSLPPAMLAQHSRIQAFVDASDEMRAFGRLHNGAVWYIPVNDTTPYLTADSARIYYRKDWLDELGLDVPDTAEAFAETLEALRDYGRGVSGLTLAGGVTYLIAMFGVDPDSWVLENGLWTPAYYTDSMLPGLEYARELYVSGALDYEYPISKTNTVIGNLAYGRSGALIRRGDAFWLNRVYGAFGELNGLDGADVYNWHIGIMPPPSVPAGGGTEETDGTEERGRFWPRSVEYAGCVVSAAVSDEKLERMLVLLEYTLSEEGRELAYFGIRGETCVTGADGTLKLFIDPATMLPFDIFYEYPSTQLLFILDRSVNRLGEHSSVIPSEMPPVLKTACLDAAAMYNPYAIDEGDGFLVRFINTSAKYALEASFDYNAGFNRIVTGDAPVEEMFAEFRADCEQHNIRAAIMEVTARMREVTGGYNAD